jgi:hypothetical protein
MNGIHIALNGEDHGIVPLAFIEGAPCFGDGAYSVYDHYYDDKRNDQTAYQLFEQAVCALVPSLTLNVPQALTVNGDTFILTLVACDRFGMEVFMKPAIGQPVRVETPMPLRTLCDNRTHWVETGIVVDVYPAADREYRVDVQGADNVWLGCAPECIRVVQS